jgi:hypothetical protein
MNANPAKDNPVLQHFEISLLPSCIYYHSTIPSRYS